MYKANFINFQCSLYNSKIRPPQNRFFFLKHLNNTVEEIVNFPDFKLRIHQIQILLNNRMIAVQIGIAKSMIIPYIKYASAYVVLLSGKCIPIDNYCCNLSEGG